MKEKLFNGNLKIEEYSFHEFLASFQEAVLEGYRLDLESNENFPTKYGDFLSTVLVPIKPEITELTADASKPVPLDTPKVKAKAKAA